MRKINLKTILAKTVLYRAIVIFIQAAFTFMYVRDLSKCFEISIIWNVVNVGLYFVYECLFSKRYSVAVQTKGTVVWLTGKPCSGKTTIALDIIPKLQAKGYNVHRLDGDVVRKSLCSDLGFSEADRAQNLKRVSYVAKALADLDTIVFCSFVSPFEEARNDIKKFIGEDKFIEVHVNCSGRECMRRDVKGMWAKAVAGEIKGFTGYDAPYEIPTHPNITLNTNFETLEESTEKLMLYLQKHKII